MRHGNGTSPRRRRRVLAITRIARRDHVAVVDCSAEFRADQARCVELIQLMWRRYPWLPVVLIGEAPGEQLRAEVLLSGVRDFLTNDVSPGCS